MKFIAFYLIPFFGLVEYLLVLKWANKKCEGSALYRTWAKWQNSKSEQGCIWGKTGSEKYEN